MKKIFLSLTVILSFILYSLSQRFEGSGETNTAVTPSINSSIPMTTSAPTKGNGSLPQYKDGEYAGNVIDAYYGNVQVKAVISAGKISDVQFLQYPKERRNSIVINTQAMPYLIQEAIQVQNADVDIVSGATQTSKSFRQSLQSALDKSKIKV